jgi:histidine triad (HIT) family protein
MAGYSGRMSSIFTRIIAGELPAHFVWKDEHCVAFLSINPIRAGHLLVVPREEVDHWIDLPPTLLAHLTTVARTLAVALQTAFAPEKVGLMIAGLEVRHVHLHVLPIDELDDLNFANADPHPAPQALQDAADRVRSALRASGARQVAGG